MVPQSLLTKQSSKLAILFIVEAILVGLCATSKTGRIDLSDIPWIFFDSSGQFYGTTTIPSNIYTDLYRNNLTAEPLRDDNDVELAWVGKLDWIYATNFTAPKYWNQCKVILLKIDGLDTVANVWLNSKLILQSRNQFLSYLLPITNWKSGANNLTVVFKSPVEYARKKAASYYLANSHDVPPICPPKSYHGECHVNFLSFGWDWGPSFPTVGIWQPMSIIGFQLLYVDRLSVSVKKDNGAFLVTAEISSYSAISDDVHLLIKLPELRIFGSSKLKILGMQQNVLKSSFIVPANKVELWWPNGYGKQKLYKIYAEISIRGQIFAPPPVKIGFRTVTLDQSYVYSKEPDKGRNFYFKVNDVPVFLKGTNWIPLSAFESDDQTERMRFLLDSVVAANMNTMRVWGGGRYETDEFYDLADEMGILLWQDFMFACALYPVDTSFLSSVRNEVTQQVWRLRHHPSILLWAGNNENELGIADRWYTAFNYKYEEMIRDYMVLYNSTIMAAVTALDDTRPYILSSPSNGIESERAGGVSNYPGDQKFGDIHYYADYVDLWKDSTYQIPRCATEYGVQSLPAKETMLHWLNESDYHFMSKNFLDRQHRPAGTLSLLANVYSHFKIFDGCSLKKTDKCNGKMTGFSLERFTYYTQMHQALAYQMETEHYRRWRGRLTENGLGNTMCALYWQLNDVWSAPSWSSVDFDLSWKPVHYFARRFFADVIVSTYLNNEKTLEVFVVSDYTYSLKQHFLILDTFAWTGGFRPVYTEKQVVNIRPQSSERIQFGSLRYTQMRRYASTNSEEDYIIRVRLVSPKGVQVGYDSILLPDLLFKVDLSHLGDVRIGSLNPIDPLTYEIKVVATSLAPLVWLTLPTGVRGWFSDNAFTMTEPEKSVRLTLWTRPSSPLRKEEIKICFLKNCGKASN